MRHETQVHLLKELMRQLDQGVNNDAGGLRKNPASGAVTGSLATSPDPEPQSTQATALWLGVWSPSS